MTVRVTAARAQSLGGAVFLGSEQELGVAAYRPVDLDTTLAAGFELPWNSPSLRIGFLAVQVPSPFWPCPASLLAYRTAISARPNSSLFRLLQVVRPNPQNPFH